MLNVAVECKFHKNLGGIAKPFSERHSENFSDGCHFYASEVDGGSLPAMYSLLPEHVDARVAERNGFIVETCE